MDIIQAEVHRIWLSDNNRHDVVKMHTEGESIGAIALTSDENVLLVCAKYGVAKGDFLSGKVEYILRYPHTEAQKTRLRSNDGIVDPWGHLWIGVMNDFPITAKEGVKPEGRLYRINSQDLSIETMVSDTYILNGLNFSADGKRFFWTDSLTFTVWQYDYDYATNTLSNKRPLVDARTLFPDVASPEPDGFAISTDDDIFTAVFGTGQVVQVSESRAENRWKVPAERVTCVAIGGKDDNDLFVTTGHLELGDFEKEIDPSDKTGDLGGFLFRVRSEKPLKGKQKSVWGGKV